MNWKINRNEKQKYSNKEKLALGEGENTKRSNKYCPEGWIVTKLENKKVLIYHLKMF